MNFNHNFSKHVPLHSSLIKFVFYSFCMVNHFQGKHFQEAIQCILQKLKSSSDNPHFSPFFLDERDQEAGLE